MVITKIKQVDFPRQSKIKQEFLTGTCKILQDVFFFKIKQDFSRDLARSMITKIKQDGPDKNWQDGDYQD